MALFGRDRERSERPPPVRGPETSSVAGLAPREVEMFERDREAAQPAEASGTSAFLGKGSRVSGKLGIESVHGLPRVAQGPEHHFSHQSFVHCNINDQKPTRTPPCPCRRAVPQRRCAAPARPAKIAAAGSGVADTR